MVSNLERCLSDALDALAEVIRIASEKTAADAVEFVGDWLNGHDVVVEEDIPAFQRWVDRGRP